MFGLSKISCTALLLMLPLAAGATEMELDEIALDEGTMVVVDTTPIVTLGKIEATDIPVVMEELPEMTEQEKLVAAMLTKAQEENARRGDMRRAELSETECLATAMYHEARGEGETGLKAVAFVIYNRVKSEIFPDDFCNVILQRSQFSFTADRNPDNIKEWETYRKVLAMAVELVHNGGFQRIASPVGGAMFFHSFARRSAWRYASSRRFIATIGNHHFFK